MHLACLNGLTSFVKKLLDTPSSSANRIDCRAESPLDAAVRGGHLATCELVINMGAGSLSQRVALYRACTTMSEPAHAVALAIISAGDVDPSRRVSDRVVSHLPIASLPFLALASSARQWNPSPADILRERGFSDRADNLVAEYSKKILSLADDASSGVCAVSSRTHRQWIVEMRSPSRVADDRVRSP